MKVVTCKRSVRGHADDADDRPGRGRHPERRSTPENPVGTYRNVSVIKNVTHCTFAVLGVACCGAVTQLAHRRAIPEHYSIIQSKVTMREMQAQK